MPPIRILVAGSANVDLVTRVPRIPRGGETLIGTHFTTVPGGKGANQAVAAARLGAQTCFIGCVGADGFGAYQRETLLKDGVNVDALKVHPTEPTGTAVILIADDGQNTIVVTPAANSGLRPEDIAVLESMFRGAGALLLQLETPLDTVAAALDLARAYGVLSILDAGPAQPVSPELLRKADIVSPNETETEAITGIPVNNVEDGWKAARRLREMGAREVVLKLGASGALSLGAEEVYVPAFPIIPVDTVAAGDAFTAALALALCEGMGRADALRFANATGALAATTPGAQDSMPTRAAVERFLATHGG